MNPFSIIDGLLADYASPKVRRLLHTLLVLLVALVAIWQAAEGDWKKFGLALLAMIYAEANRANTPPTSPFGPDDDVTYYDAP